jgi:hypothetical protein
MGNKKIQLLSFNNFKNSKPLKNRLNIVGTTWNSFVLMKFLKDMFLETLLFPGTDRLKNELMRKLTLCLFEPRAVTSSLASF